MADYPYRVFQKKAEEAFRAALGKLGISTDIPVEEPPEGMGDFGFACHALARELKRSPVEIAVDLVQAVEVPEGLRCESKGPYVNFWMDETTFIQNTLDSVFELEGDYGKGSLSGRVILEHTSANPNGPFHVGRARNPIIGDTMARLLKFAGYEVEVQYWVNDMGKQAAILTWGCKNIPETNLPEAGLDKPDHDLVRYYQEANRIMEEDPGVQDEISSMLLVYEKAVADDDLDRSISGGDRAVITATDVQECSRKVLDGMVQSLKDLNVNYDKFVWESESVSSHDVDKVIEGLNSSSYSEVTSDGARYIDMEHFGIQGRNTEFVYTRSDGSSLYTTRDLAYHQVKLSNCDIAINVLGEDHKLQSQQLGEMLKLLGLENIPEVIFYAFVALPEGKMSTRKGVVVFLELARQEVEKRRAELPDGEKKQISDMVGIAAIRYNIIRVQSDKKIVFKWEDALNFEGDSAPFIQYTYARASSILRRSELRLEDVEGDWSLLTHPSEVALVKEMARFPVVVVEATEGRRPHFIAGYAHNLASAFNQFYRDCQVISEDEVLMGTRLKLVEAFRIVLGNTLGILGIDAPESM
jgi:arginyl-tRNA synthetase